jgi:hypothetical protein
MGVPVERDTDTQTIPPAIRHSLSLKALTILLGCAAVFAFLGRYPQNRLVTSDPLSRFQEDTAYGWKDNIWPIRPQAPWDISTDFAHPRKLKYEVQEGTWLRLDVSIHGEIVFDMLGESPAISIATSVPHARRR